MDEGTTIYFGILIVCATLALLAAGFVMIFLNYQKKILVRRQQLHELEIKYRHELLHECLRSAEEERVRIAKDIHDEIGGIFSSLILAINTQNREQQQPYLYKMKEVAETGLHNVRRISHAIIPFELELLGLQETLRNFIRTFSEMTCIEVNYSTSPETIQLNSEQELTIYRIIQELFSNCIKHASARSISLKIEKDHDSCILEYADNGIGMPAGPAREQRKGVGLKNIESRVLSLNGKVIFVSAANKGLSCSLHFPIAIP